MLPFLDQIVEYGQPFRACRRTSIAIEWEAGMASTVAAVRAMMIRSSFKKIGPPVGSKTKILNVFVDALLKGRSTEAPSFSSILPDDQPLSRLSHLIRRTGKRGSSDLHYKLALVVRRPGYVVEHNVEFAAGADRAATALARAILRPPVDEYSEHRGALHDRGHRVDVRRRRNAEFERDPVAERLVLARTADEHDPLDVVRRQSSFLDRLACGTDGVVDFFSYQRVELRSRDRAVDVNLRS